MPEDDPLELLEQRIEKVAADLEAAEELIEAAKELANERLETAKERLAEIEAFRRVAESRLAIVMQSIVRIFQDGGGNKFGDEWEQLEVDDKKILADIDERIANNLTFDR